VGELRGDGSDDERVVTRPIHSPPLFVLGEGVRGASAIFV
jgi:hypothetical protein